MKFRSYLTKQKKIIESEEQAEEDQWRQVYEEYSIETLIKSGHLFYFNEKTGRINKEINSYIFDDVDDEIEIFKKMGFDSVLRIVIISIPVDLDISTSYLNFDFLDKKISVDYYDPHFENNHVFETKHLEKNIRKINFTTFEIENLKIQEHIEQDYIIMKMPFTITYQKYITKLDNIYLDEKNGFNGDYMKLLKVLSLNYFPELPKINNTKINFVKENLNSEQKEIIKKSLNCDKFFLIHGPPGTGKTTVISELLRQLSFQRKKALILAPTNVAVDNMILSVREFERKFFDNLYLKEFKLKTLIRKKSSFIEIEKLQQEINLLKILYPRKLIITRIGNVNKISKDNLVQNIYLTKKVKNPNQILIKSDIIATTIDSTFINHFYNKFLYSLEDKTYFDYTIIDEAAKSMNFQSLACLCNTKRVIFAGDHLQLPPTVKANSNQNHKSLFEELMIKYKNYKDKNKFIGTLQTQYRMDNNIMELSSKFFYPFLKCGRENYENNYPNEYPILFLDTKNSKFYEESKKSNRNTPFQCSSFNKKEAVLAYFKYLQLLKNKQVFPEDVGIIAAYSSQVDFLRSVFKKNLNYQDIPEINTVDSFQGREKKVIILSFVRSNEHKQIGFLKEKRRINVSITRAQKMLILIGDSNTLETDSYLKFVIDSIDCKYMDYNADIKDTNSISEYDLKRLKRYFY